MELNPQNLSTQQMYKLMTGTIVPRPIGWISTVDVDGVPNLAPYSYFNAVCADPPHLLFCPGVRASDELPAQKDTLRNVRATGQFVVNIVTEALAEAMNATAAQLPPGTSEFEHAGLSTAPSQVVRPPRVAESPVHFECEVVHIYEVGDAPGAGSVVIGHVLHAHVADDLVDEAYRVDIARLQPVGRLAGSSYSRVNEIFELKRE